MRYDHKAPGTFIFLLTRAIQPLCALPGKNDVFAVVRGNLFCLGSCIAPLGEGEGAAAAFVRAPNDMPATVEPNSLARPQFSHSAAPCTPLF